MLGRCMYAFKYLDTYNITAFQAPLKSAVCWSPNDVAVNKNKESTDKQWSDNQNSQHRQAITDKQSSTDGFPYTDPCSGL